MASGYSDDCGEYAVTPMFVAPCYPHCEEIPACYPCLPRCPKEVVYCCERPPARPKSPDPEPCCRRVYVTRERPKERTSHQRKDRSPSEPRHSRARCCEPVCEPVRTKYVIPCYRYEDGRIERYVPLKHGRLPTSAYRRNGIQDQVYGYRAAIRMLCCRQTREGCCVHTAVEPLRTIHAKVTDEMWPVKKKKPKPCT